ncbi:MAG: ceramidase domain-containing protein [Alphaproteobacteria bacterium]
MEHSVKIFDYCERGLDPSFWAEPLNAITNLGFIVASVLAFWELAARSAGESKWFRYLLIANVFAIGVGSFLFHTYATADTALADVAPIGLFMLVYLGYALYRFVGLPVVVVVPAQMAFAYVIKQAMELECWSWKLGFSLPATSFEGRTCMNGSLGYMPALAVMLLIGGWLMIRRHPAAKLILGAAIVFTLSVSLRTMDRVWCQDVVLFGKAVGVHFLWHIFNSVTLYLLLLAAVRHSVARKAG